MTKSLTGTIIAGLLLVAVAWTIAIPLGASNGVLGVLALAATSIAAIAHTNHIIEQDRQRQKSR
ncbi:MAG: hypothetical protein ACRDKV_02300 [Solirubrobacterales bacterium]